MKKTSLSTITAVTAALLLASLMAGRYRIGLDVVEAGSLSNLVFREIRLPRVIASAILGLVLGSTGATLQSSFRNPLVGPGIIGLSQGAAFGAAFSILYLGGSALTVEVTSTFFGLVAFGIAYTIHGYIRQGDPSLRLILSGLIVSAFFSGALGAVKALADPFNKLPELTFWLLGGLSGVTWSDIWFMAPLAAAGLTVIMALRWRVNHLSLDDEVAHSMGVDPGRLRVIIVAASVVAVAGVTSVAGVISWVGLLAPHIGRRLVGVDSRRLIPASGLIGSCMVMAFDSISRSVSASEIPLGITVSLLGAPMFFLLLARRTEVE